MSDTDHKSDSESNSTNSEEYEEKKPNKTKRGPRNTRLCVVADGEYLCKRCKKIFSTKNKAYKHDCNKKEKQMLNKCMWCGLEFANRGNLASHAFHIHGDSRYEGNEVNMAQTMKHSAHSDVPLKQSLKSRI
ncbi:hypothetical protein O0L34_g15878 [Tuta absoluta]|nr:hypothetical protein O0L34_g15878 [Tuta absoluta]